MTETGSVDDPKLVWLRWPEDARRVLDPALKADDYLQLERSRSANIDWVGWEFTDPPPGRSVADMLHPGLELADGTLAGFATLIRGFRAPDEWWIGLMLLDPAHRSRGLGRVLLRHIEGCARAENARTLGLVVLPGNPRGRAFWTREGFRYDGLSTPPPGQIPKPLLSKII